MRYSFDEGLIDFAKGEVIEYAELLEEIMVFIEEDALQLGCVHEIDSLRQILDEGTSAHNQLAVYSKAIESGVSHRDALIGVVDWLIEQTVKDL